MHPAVLATGGYALILSGIAALVLLLRKNIKRCIGSSLHMLAMSDILSSVLTGILLIINQYALPNDGPFGKPETNEATSNRTWMKFLPTMDQENPRFVIESSGLLNSSESGENDNAEETSSCNFHNIVVHYAMFIFPFANAFISLLSFSVRANVDLNHMASICSQITGSSRSTRNDNESEDSRDSENVCSRKRSEMQVIGFGIIAQWIVPVLMIAVVQLAERETTENLQRSNDMGCVYGTNFPFENCYNVETTSIEELANEVEYTTPSTNDYIGSIDSSRITEMNSTNVAEFADVVAKIHKIVGSVMNSTGNEKPTRAPSHYDVSQLSNIMRLMESMNSNEDQKETIDESSSSDDYSDSSIIVEESSSNPTMELDPLEESSSNPTMEFDPLEEIELFESLLNNSTGNFHDETEFIAAEEQTETPEESIDVEDNSSAGTNDQTKTDEEIYADIVKKIQTVSTQLRVREKFNGDRTKDQGRTRSDVRVSNEYSRSAKYREETPMCMKGQCFVSTRFLKIHLLALVFLVYFAPILMSAILHTRSRYACINIKEKLETKVSGGNANKQSKGEGNSEKKVSRSGPSGWFPAVATREHEISGSSSEDLVCATHIKKRNYSPPGIPDESPKADESLLSSIEEKTRETEQISELFKVALLLAVLLWSPIFLQILAKVFLCTNPDYRLMNSSFFGGVLFGIARNILNLRMIRTREIIHNDLKRENAVYPSS